MSNQPAQQNLQEDEIMVLMELTAMMEIVNLFEQAYHPPEPIQMEEMGDENGDHLPAAAPPIMTYFEQIPVQNYIHYNSDDEDDADYDDPITSDSDDEDITPLPIPRHSNNANRW